MATVCGFVSQLAGFTWYNIVLYLQPSQRSKSSPFCASGSRLKWDSHHFGSRLEGSAAFPPPFRVSDWSKIRHVRQNHFTDQILYGLHVSAHLIGWKQHHSPNPRPIIRFLEASREHPWQLAPWWGDWTSRWGRRPGKGGGGVDWWVSALARGHSEEKSRDGHRDCKRGWVGETILDILWPRPRVRARGRTNIVVWNNGGAKELRKQKTYKKNTFYFPFVFRLLWNMCSWCLLVKYITQQ